MKEEAVIQSKKAAAIKALEWVKNGMTLGLGTGSTAYFAIEGLSKMVREGLKVQVVASSTRSEQLASEMGIEISGFEEIQELDLYIDGADEVDKEFNLIKGGGGALVREKILAFNSREFIVVVDGSKLTEALGGFPLPVEVLPFGIELTRHQLSRLGCATTLRMQQEHAFVSDNGNRIIDCRFKEIPDPSALNQMLHAIPGVVETGLFPNKMVSALVVGAADQVTVKFPYKSR